MRKADKRMRKEVARMRKRARIFIRTLLARFGWILAHSAMGGMFLVATSVPAQETMEHGIAEVKATLRQVAADAAPAPEAAKGGNSGTVTIQDELAKSGVVVRTVTVRGNAIGREELGQEIERERNLTDAKFDDVKEQMNAWAAQQDNMISMINQNVNWNFNRLEILIGVVVLLIGGGVFWSVRRMERRAAKRAEKQAEIVTKEFLSEYASTTLDNLAADRIEHATRKVRQDIRERGTHAIREFLNQGMDEQAVKNRKDIEENARIIRDYPARNSAERLILALDAYAKRKFSDALYCLNQILESPSSATKVLLASTLCNKGIVLLAMREHEEAIHVFDSVVSEYRGEEDDEILAAIVRATNHKGIALARSKRPQDAIQIWDEVIRKYGESPNVMMQRLTAHALNEKAAWLFKTKSHDDAISTRREVVHRFGESNDADLQRVVAFALKEMAIALDKLGRTEESSNVRDEIIQRFGHSTNVDLREAIDKMFQHGGENLSEQATKGKGKQMDLENVIRKLDGSSNDVIAQRNGACILHFMASIPPTQEKSHINNEIIDRFINSQDILLQQITIKAVCRQLFNAVTNNSQQHDDPIALIEKAMSCFEHSDNSILQYYILVVMRFHADILMKQKQFNEAEKICFQILNKIPGDDLSAKVNQMRAAIMHRIAVCLHEQGQQKQAESALVELIREFGGSGRKHIKCQICLGMNLLADILEKQGMHEQANDMREEIISRFSDMPARSIKEIVYRIKKKMK